MSGTDIGQMLAALRRKLVADPGLAALHTAGVIGSDDQFPDAYDGAYSDMWLMQGIDQDGRPSRDVQSTGSTCITLNCRSGWGAANDHNTARFPQLLVFIYSDVTRLAAGAFPGSSGFVGQRDAVNKCYRVSRAIENLLHDPAGKLGQIGNSTDFPPSGVWIHKSLQAMQLNITDVPQGDGVVKGELRFNITTD